MSLSYCTLLCPSGTLPNTPWTLHDFSLLLKKDIYSFRSSKATPKMGISISKSQKVLYKVYIYTTVTYRYSSLQVLSN